jgi:hypothetical protein
MKAKIVLLVALFFLLITNLNAQNMNFYQSKWTKVDSLEQKGLPKSALKVVNEILAKAKSDKNSEQVIKSFIFQLKYENSNEENAFEALCYELDSAAKQATFPDNAIMHSMLADMYWWYYQNNRYKFQNRSNTVNFDNADMQTWTLDDLVNEIIINYNESLVKKEELQKIAAKEYKELIYSGTKPRTLRPTLYDFLAHKAIDFFSNTEIALSKPADNYELREDFYFADANTFIGKDISTSDTLSLHFHAQLILQDLLKFRLKNNKEQDALIDVDLKRLKFAYAHSVNNNKDGLYLKALQNLEKEYNTNSFSAEVSLAIAHYYYNLSGKYDPLVKETDNYKNYKVKAHEICMNIIEKFPKTNAAEHCKQLIITIETHNLSFNIESILMPDSKFSAKINYRNINKVFLRAAKISRSKYEKLQSKYSSEKFYDKVKNFADKIYELSYDLPVDKDFNEHSVEVLLNELPVGFYVLLASDNEQFNYEKALSSYQAFTVSNISYIKQQQYDGSYRFVVLNRTTGMPMQGVSCQSWYSKYSYSKRRYVTKMGLAYTTDKDGSFVIRAKKGKDSENWGVNFKLANDFLTTARNSYIYYRGHEKYSTVNTTFFTDRAIYRPGQTIYFKGISIRTDGETNKIETGYEVTVLLKDVNSQKVAELKLKTNEYGTFSGTFDIPTGLLNGNFRLECYQGVKYISVEEYKRPKFEVEMLPFKGNYLLNDEVEVEGKAISYSGAAISDANVKYRIVRTPQWRGWWYWVFSSVPVEIKNGEIHTDDNGHFKVKFKALPDLSYPESEFLSFNYQVKIDVTDINGETQSTSKNLNVGYRALQVSLPLSGLINKNDKKYDDENYKLIEIGTYNLNQEYIPASGEIKIYKLKDLPKAIRARHWGRPDKHVYLKEDWNKKFPGNIYDNESENLQLEKEKQVFMTVFNTKEQKKLDFSVVKGFETGRYVAEINSTDAFGNKVSNKHFFNVFTDEGTEVPYNIIDLFSAVNTYCEPGEEAEFLIGSSNKNVTILYQVEHKNQIISSEYLTINNEQKLIKIPVEEKHRGNFSVHFVFVKNNRYYNHSAVVYVPYTNKHLDIEFETFRDKLYPGEKEQWRLKIKGDKGDKVAAEMLATLYDASLDQFKKNYWDFNIYNSYYTMLTWNTGTFNYLSSTLIKKNLDVSHYVPSLTYDYFNWFGFNYYPGFYGGLDEVVVTGFGVSRGRQRLSFKSKSYKKESKAIPAPMMEVADAEKFDDGVLADGLLSSIITEQKGGYLHGGKVREEDFSEVKVRTNFNETAFFYPHLKTNKEGEIIVEFTVPESLTKWKMMGFATTKDLKYGSITNELVTQKDLMLLPNEPRFFRENDKITFPVKISNISENDLSGKVKLELFDAITMEPVTNIFAKGESETKDFEVKAGKNSLAAWKLEIPEGIGAIMYKVVAKAGDFSDGEQKPLPVLTNRMLVTESMPLPVRGNETKIFKFEKLVNSGKSTTLRNHKLTLEFTSNPAWYAIQALPYLMEYPYECTEQTFSRFYANSIASHIANSSPKIKRVFDSWKNTEGSKALLSNLEKNQELKSVLLEETPWVLDGKNETERKNRVGLLFDLNRMGNELGKALKKVQKAQKLNGGWPWFKGMPESRYITHHIVTGLGHLDKLGVKTVRTDDKTWNMLKKAIAYLDIRIKEDYNWLKRNYTKEELKENHLSSTAIQYLYGRSYFVDIEIPAKSKEAFDYYKGQAETYWLSQSKYMQGMIALCLHRYENKTVPADIVKSLKENSTSNEEMGMYWKDNVGGWYWYQAPIETHALMIEVFDEVANDQAAVNDLKIWLLKQKQTQDWKTTKATTEAVYSLLLRGSDWLASDKLVEIKMGEKIIDPKKMDDVKVEAGTGYFKTSWSGGDIKPEMGNVTVSKSDEGVSWGAVYWQYFEQLDKITPHETPLKLKKQLFIEKLTERGKIIEPISDNNELKIGDKVIVRIELRVDRRMEYIHMKDMRASGFEPINVISTYKWQDNLGYYESTKDAATNFFMEALPKGTYVFEYPLRVTHKGDFSNGVTTIQCMYAPEFTAHSEGIRVKVEK